MFEKAKQEPAQRFLRNDFPGALKYVFYCLYIYYKTAKLGMNLAVVITKFGFFGYSMPIFIV